MGTCYWKQLTRRKPLTAFQQTDGTAGSLGRVLGLCDLIFLGIGSTLGVGIYILPGSVAKTDAGPAIVISFFIAAIISILAGICYAEFSARAPTTGSMYSYTYMALGELLAFTMGWNLIMQYIIGSASVIKALSVYGDSFINYTIQTHLQELYEIDVPYLSRYFDVVAFALSILLAVLLSFGLRESIVLNNVLTGVNVCMVLFCVFLGMTKIDFRNWNLNVLAEGRTDAGGGGFFPYGFNGVIKGATACFFGFIGFDCIVTTGNEVKRPTITIPIALITSIMVSFFTYFALSSVLTLMVPYYLQDTAAPLASAFDFVGLKWAQIIVEIGTFFGMSASLIGAFFPASRIMYAMSQDGLLFGVLGQINVKYGTPVVATMCSGILTGLTAAVLDVEHLIYLNSLGTLLSYCVIAVCVIILAYSDVGERSVVGEESSPLLYQSKRKSSDDIDDEPKEGANEIKRAVVKNTFLICALSVLFSLVIGMDLPYKSVVMGIIGFCMLVLLSILGMQTPSEERRHSTFKVPWVPFIPALSILLDVYLLMQFDVYSWIRFCFTLVAGLVIYFAYGIFHSKERQNKQNEL